MHSYLFAYSSIYIHILCEWAVKALSKLCGSFVCLFGLWFYIPVNSSGHVETVS